MIKTQQNSDKIAMTISMLCVIHCFFEFLKIKKISSLEIRDLCLISNFEEQENLIYFEKDNKLSTLKINVSELSAKIKF